jgi:hypothetical protein
MEHDGAFEQYGIVKVGRVPPDPEPVAGLPTRVSAQ